MQYIAFDVHKRYTWASAEDRSGRLVRQGRIEHQPGEIAEFLGALEPGSPVAVETVGNWYWVVDVIEAAGMEPRLVNARLAKLMMGQINKTDKLDARGLNRLQRRTNINRYLKWAFVKAANGALLHRRTRCRAHVVALYDRVKAKRGHGKAKLAMARHLAEAAFWVLTTQEPYRLPESSKRG
jgi:hypothetical protein